MVTIHDFLYIMATFRTVKRCEATIFHGQLPWWTSRPAPCPVRAHTAASSRQASASRAHCGRFICISSEASPGELPTLGRRDCDWDWSKQYVKRILQTTNVIGKSHHTQTQTKCSQDKSTVALWRNDRIPWFFQLHGHSNLTAGRPPKKVGPLDSIGTSKSPMKNGGSVHWDNHWTGEGFLVVS